MATVLIIGASRGIGLETVKAALEAGHSVRALAVSFQQIVHPVLTEETEVAEASDSEGKPDEHA